MHKASDETGAPTPFAQTFAEALRDRSPITIEPTWFPSGWQRAAGTQPFELPDCRSSAREACRLGGWARVRIVAPSAITRPAVSFLIGLWDENVPYALIAPERTRTAVVLPSQRLPEACVSSVASSAVLDCVLPNAARGEYRVFYVLARLGRTPS